MIDEFLPTLDIKDPSYGVRLQGLDKMRVGLFGILQGVLMTLDARRAELADRRQLAATLHLRGRSLASTLKPEHSQQIQQWLANVIAKEKDAQIRGDLQGVMAALKSSVGEAAPR